MKDLIKKRLDVLKEENVNGLAITTQVQKKGGAFNKEYYNDVKNKMADYDKAAKQEDKDAIDPVKDEYTSEEEEYHNQMEIRNGQEMLKYDNKPDERFKERAEAALVGDSKMGNKTYEGEWNPETGEGNGNTEEVWGSSGGKHTGEEIVKNAKASAKKRNDAEYNLVQFGDDIEQSAESKTRGKARKIAVENKNNKKPIKEKKMKRLRFKKEFNGMKNALSLIPESYRVDGKEFEMTDGNESYTIRWEGTLEEGKAVVLQASNRQFVNEDVNKIKHLYNYRSNETQGNLSGRERLAENESFRDIWDKTRELMKENEEKAQAELKESFVYKLMYPTLNEADEATKKGLVTEGENIDGQTAPEGKSSDAGHGKKGAHPDHVMEDEVTEDIQESKRKELAESIMRLMEETGLSEEEVVEGLFGGPSKEEQERNRQALMQKAQQLAQEGESNGWKIGYLFDGKPVNSLEELMQIAAKNKFRGQMIPRPIKARGTLYIEYKKGLTGLQKFASGSGSQTVGA